MAAAAFIPTPSFAYVSARVQSSVRRAVDGSNIRQIGQATLIYACDHDDQFPVAMDVWDYARLLAESTGLDDAHMWQSRLDPAVDSNSDELTTILRPRQPGSPRQLDPLFRKIKPSIAVALGKLDSKIPATTPIAWTRGLQLDGTWAKHSPYGTTGGWIAFSGGNAAFYRDLKDEGGQLTRFDGKGKTANILEALPPGTRISEYLPTSEEQVAWANATEQRLKAEFRQRYLPPILLFLIVWFPFSLVALFRLIKKQGRVARTFIGPAILTLLILFLFSIVC